MSEPPLSVHDYYVWDEPSQLPGSTLEADLSWPHGSLSVLHEAFKKQLSRKTGWTIPSGPYTSAFQMAARVFRRGLAVRDQQGRMLSGSYLIQFLPKLNWAELLPDQHLCIIDQQFALAQNIPAKSNRVFIQVTELSKNLKTVAQLQHTARLLGSYETWTIVGGGVLADTAAFAAALESRLFRLIPTTVLAMVDACIGGKTGVNFPPYGKNQIGLFAFPSEVIISTDCLSTLPQREFLAGLNEAWKHALLKGDPSLGAAVAQLDLHPQNLDGYMRDLVAVKADVVALDPTEQGLRASLNLGHTLAHSIERISQKVCPERPILHGEAVGVGLLFCIQLSHTLDYLAMDSYQSMTQQLLNSNALITLKQLQSFLGTEDLTNPNLIEELLVGIKQDKKNKTAHASEWVLLQDWGQLVTDAAHYTVPVEDSVFRGAYVEFIKFWQIAAPKKT